ncbi:MAG: NADH-quinone oxidoreductase subunit, partial [Conexibacter sp.]|nr:NADH-quinone oxidoreductase subunit [Conexibacter sp.]
MPVRRDLRPLLAIAALGAAGGLSIWQWGDSKDLVAGALRADELAMALNLIFCVAGIATVLLSWRSVAPREAAHGEYY